MKVEVNITIQRVGVTHLFFEGTYEEFIRVSEKLGIIEPVKIGGC